MEKIWLFALPLAFKLLSQKKKPPAAPAAPPTAVKEMQFDEIPAAALTKLRSILPASDTHYEQPPDKPLVYQARTVDPKLKTKVEDSIRADLAKLPLPSEFIISRRKRK